MINIIMIIIIITENKNTIEIINTTYKILEIRTLQIGSFFLQIN